jgi:ubiquitin C-terminal hydrolase
LIDALERTFARTNKSIDIRALFGGIIEPYFVCDTCGRKSLRDEEFCDLSLLVQGMPSLEASLAAFIAPEVIEGYRCSDCNQVGNPLRASTLKLLPPILLLQLRRFDFDYTTFNRIKINSRFEFPWVLDMTPYTKDAGVDNKNNLNNNLNNNKYDLATVFVHTGGAHGGHYYVYAKDFERQVWYAIIVFVERHSTRLSLSLSLSRYNHTDLCILLE